MYPEQPVAQMNVSIPDPMKAWCEAQVESGRYSTASDYVRDLIRRDQDKRQHQFSSEIQSMIDQAIASGVSADNLDQIFAAARAQAND